MDSLLRALDLSSQKKNVDMFRRRWTVERFAFRREHGGRKHDQHRQQRPPPPPYQLGVGGQVYCGGRRGRHSPRRRHQAGTSAAHKKHVDERVLRDTVGGASAVGRVQADVKSRVGTMYVLIRFLVTFLFPLFFLFLFEGMLLSVIAAEACTPHC